MSVATNTVNSLPPPDPRGLIQAERAASKFDPVKMHHFLESSKEKADEMKLFLQQLERDPILTNDATYYEKNKEEQREMTVLKVARWSQYLELDPNFLGTRASLLGVFDPQVATRIAINLILFLGCVRGNGTEAQTNYWTNQKETKYLKGIYGCFGMTELAHGSNVAGLETTATFDKATDEFVINTPHVGATKWWIGGAAHSATHCSVYARLIVDGKDYGVKTFVVPLRDSNHNLMPGVSLGDIGAKMGRDGIDNGWIQFSSVRVPRFYMLQRYCKVTAEGDVTLPPLEQLAYSALLDGRVSMVMDSFRWTARFAIIALRYAVGRRQFKSASQKDGTETQLLNYPLHQRKLLPLLAQAYVFSPGSFKLAYSLLETNETLEANVASGDMKKILGSIDGMKSLFIDSAALKSTATWLTADCIDQARQSCGGHGYSAYNGFGKAFDDWVVMCTWEGDNSVMAMSVGKPVIKSVSSVVKKGTKLQGSLAFLNNAKEYNNTEYIFQNASDLLDFDKALKAIEVLITRIAIKGAEVVAENNGNFDSVGAPSLSISKLTAHHYFLAEYVRRVKENKDTELNPFLIPIAQLYVTANVVEKFSGDFLAYNVLPSQAVNDVVNKVVPALCKEIRPNVIAYTDSFQYTDFLVNSQIGKYDGNFYENYFTTVKQLNPPLNTKAPHSATLEALLARAPLDVRQRGEKSAEAASILSR